MKSIHSLYYKLETYTENVVISVLQSRSIEKLLRATLIQTGQMKQKELGKMRYGKKRMLLYYHVKTCPSFIPLRLKDLSNIDLQGRTFLQGDLLVAQNVL